MILLAKELSKDNMGTHLGHLFSGFGGERGKEVIAALTDMHSNEIEDLGWEYINLSFERLVTVAEKLINDKEKRYHGISGIITMAIELAKNNMETNPGHLFSGFKRTYTTMVINTLIELKELKGNLITDILDLKWRYFGLPLPDVLTMRNIRLDWDTRELVVQKENPKQGLIGKETRYPMQKYNGYFGFEAFIQRLKEEHIFKTKTKNRFNLLVCISFDEVRYFMQWYLKSFVVTSLDTARNDDGFSLTTITKDTSYVGADPADIIIAKEELREQTNELIEEEEKKLKQIKTAIDDTIFNRLLELAGLVNRDRKEEREYWRLLNLVKSKIPKQELRSASIESTNSTGRSSRLELRVNM
jgi:hydroxylamine reductase (hybrid-cluster protein)